jgi:hypothetical protein
VTTGWRNLSSFSRRRTDFAPTWFAKYGNNWRFEVRGKEFIELSNSGGSTEGGAWVYQVKPTKVIAFGDAHGQTTYRF